MGVNNISNAEALMKKLDVNHDGVIDKKDNLSEQIQKELGLNEGKSYTKENIEDVSDKLAKLGVEVENLTQGAEKPQMGVLKAEKLQKEEMPTTGRYHAEMLEDGTQLKFDHEAGTVTKYDADGNVMFEKSIQEYKRQELEDRIKNLKPGESMQYEESQSINGSNFSSSTKNIITVTRKENGELVETRAGVLHRVSYPKIQGVSLNTTYDENHENKVSEDFIDPRKYQWGVVSTRHFENGKEKSVVTDLSKMDEYVDSPRLRIHLSNSSKKYSSQQLKNAKGEVVLTVDKDGNFYNAKGKKIGEDKVFDIIQKLRDKNEFGELIQER